MAKELTTEQVRALAADTGLSRLTDEHLQQLTRATNMARARRDSIRRETLVPSDEPAHVYRIEDVR